MTTRIATRPLAEGDLLGDFRSGHLALDRFIAQYARQNQRKNLSVTWLALRENEVAGYATIVSASVEAASLVAALPKLPDYPAPVLLLARMATDERHLGHRVGTHLLRIVFREALEQATRSGCVGVFTDAKPPVDGKPKAEDFYLKFGFTVVQAPSEKKPTTGMFVTLKSMKLQLEAIEKALAP